MALSKRVVLVDPRAAPGTTRRLGAELDYSSFILNGMVYSQSIGWPWKVTGV